MLKKSQLASLGAFLTLFLMAPAAPASANDGLDQDSSSIVRAVAMPQSQDPDGESTQTEEEALAELAEVDASFTSASHQINSALQDLNEQFPDVVSYYSQDAESWSFHVSYSGNADPARIESYLDALGEIVATSDFPVEVTENSWTLADQSSVVEAIAFDPDKWADVLNGPVVSVFPEADGSITVGVTGEGGVELDVSGFLVRSMSVEISEDLGPQGILNDTAPWTPGSRILNSISVCTQGFSWSQWSTGYTGVGTALHCGTGTFLNGLADTTIGTTFVTSSVATDQQLIRTTAASGAVYVTWVTTYPVVGASVLGPGSVVAQVGQTSGVHTTSVAGVGAYAIMRSGSGGAATTIGPLTVTWSNLCRGGDSGGPFVTTTGSPQAMAHGQHWGAWNFASITGNSNGYCAYFHINTVSGALASTLVLAS